ncbi:hypothetical protein EOM33_06605 [Candidatus Saccharibacteria bacterium]|nr:hypothetical protein [Candidatus Saccharibacteria bacterium]
MSISLAQLQATVDHASATFIQEQQARKAEFENSSLRATEEYEKQFWEWAADIRIVANTITTITDEIDDDIPDPTRRLLLEVFGYIRDELLDMYRELQSVSSSKIETEFEYKEMFTPDEWEKIRQDELYVSWRRDHPHEGLQEYLTELFQRVLGEKQIKADVRIELDIPYIPGYYDVTLSRTAAEKDTSIGVYGVYANVTFLR